MKKQQQLATLIHTYCKSYIDNNLWVVMQVHKHAKLCMEHPGDAEQHIDFIHNILSASTHRDYDITLLTCDDTVIKHWIHQSVLPPLITHDDSPISSILESMTDEAKACLSLLKDTFTARLNDRCLRVLVYLLQLKRLRVFKPKTDPKLDIVKICFHLLFEWCQNNTDCQDFVGYASDLFFYKVKKKETKDRYPALLVSFIVGFNGKVVFEPLDIKEKDTVVSKMSYLYQCIEEDESAIEDVKACKERKSLETVNAAKRLIINGVHKSSGSDGITIRKCQ
jgi:hypothetical protein